MSKATVTQPVTSSLLEVPADALVTDTPVNALTAVADPAAAMFERLARDPKVDPEKLERLIALQERIMRHNAKAAFDSAFSKMQPYIPEIDEKGQIRVKDTVRSTYAKLEDIHKVIKPILAKYGFAVRHRTEWPSDKPNIIRVVGILSHEQGHSEESVFEAPKDASDYRTDIQSQGSTVSYGRRYTTIDLLNISTRGSDNDGQTKPQPPDGFDKWWKQIEAAAANGQLEFDAAWETSDAQFKNYTVKHMKQEWESLKRSVPQRGRR